MLGLLDACVKRLKEQGMQGMLLDAVMGGDEGFYAMGKHLTLSSGGSYNATTLGCSAFLPLPPPGVLFADVRPVSQASKSATAIGKYGALFQMSDSTLRYIQVRRLSTFVSRFRLTAKATRQFIRSSHGQKVFAATKRPNACSYHTNMHICKYNIFFFYLVALSASAGTKPSYLSTAPWLISKTPELVG